MLWLFFALFRSDTLCVPPCVQVVVLEAENLPEDQIDRILSKLFVQAPTSPKNTTTMASSPDTAERMSPLAVRELEEAKKSNRQSGLFGY